jgi:hypothetical protein
MFVEIPHELGTEHSVRYACIIARDRVLAVEMLERLIACNPHKSDSVTMLADACVLEDADVIDAASSV